MSARPILVELLKRDRAILAFGLAGVAILSWTYLIYSAVGPAYGGFGFTNDGEDEQSLGRRVAARRRSLSVQPSEICLSGSLPISNGFFRYRMATWLVGRL
jgi:predicted metal-binding membrane protein